MFPQNSSMNQSLQHHQQPQPQIYQNQNQNSNNNNSISGPPINSLFDNLRNDKSFQTPTKNFYQPQQVVHQDTPIAGNNLNVSGFNQSRIMSPIPHGTDFNTSYQNPMHQSAVSYNNQLVNDYTRFNQREISKK